MAEIGSTAPTKIVTTKKEKDPRRVEAGKRLAVISRQAKERKRIRESQGTIGTQESVGSIAPTSYMIALTTAGVVVALATLWYTMYPRKRTLVPTVEEDPIETQKEPHPTESLYWGSLKISSQYIIVGKYWLLLHHEIHKRAPWSGDQHIRRQGRQRVV